MTTHVDGFPSPVALKPSPIPSKVNWDRKKGRIESILAKVIHHAAWRMRRLEYAWSFVERELASTVAVPWPRRLRMWRHGFLGESAVLYDFSRTDRRRYLSNFTRFVRTRDINGDHGRLLDDKELFTLLLASRGCPVPRILGRVSKGALIDADGECEWRDGARALLSRLRRHRTLVLKPATGGGGSGITVLRDNGDAIRLNGRPIPKADLPHFLEERDGYLITEFATQHETLSRLYPNATNTMRLVTMQDDETEPFLAASVLRIGTSGSAPTDNWGQGGLSARIDPFTGRLGPAAAYPAGRDRLDWLRIHPDSGTVIEGFEIPGWREIMSGLLETVRRMPFFRYVGWDVVATADGFQILEGNNFTDINHIQIHGPLLDDPRIAKFFRRHGVI